MDVAELWPTRRRARASAGLPSLDHLIDPEDLYGNQPLSLPPEPPKAHVGTRKVYAQGTAHSGGRRTHLGTRHGGQRVGLVLAEEMLHVYDPDGVAIARISWPQPGGPHDIIHASKPPYEIPPGLVSEVMRFRRL
ncbi:hypothetical protein [Acidipropionibacterium acidipropionici]|uniref:hypothetical protein n=1 Tax=Acidipropionibacterium acidipropionici TaxID=1748 RepID=UPI00110B7B6B|nr:hypothetical protein [Acidipropionibacterium acidipropionici]QCV96500.1 hypothetical protein FEZ30_15700 [Acidipropionibacterium acidipropionici]